MIRSLKTLALALVAVLALGALIAQVASAAPKWTPVPSEYPVTVKGTQATPNKIALEGGRAVTCAFATFAGIVSNKGEAEDSELTVSPGFSGCTTTILGDDDLTTISLNECKFRFTYTETPVGTIHNEGWEATGKEFHLVCPVGNQIEIHVFTSEVGDEDNTPLCTYKIDSQTPGGDVDYRITEKEINGNGTWGDLKWTLTGITVTRAVGTATNCGGATQSGALTGETKVEWFNSLGTMIRGKFED